MSFYRDAFGWTPQVMSETDDFRLTAIMDGEAGAPGQPVAGIMDANAHLAAGEGARWEIYVSVDDADKTLATVSEMGGMIIQQAADTPFGRLGTCATRWAPSSTSSAASADVIVDAGPIRG